MAQIISGYSPIDESRRGCRPGLLVEFLVGADIDHQHPAWAERPAGNLEEPGQISHRARSDQVEAVADIERLGPDTFDMDVAQAHLDHRLVQVGRSLAPRLDQSHLCVYRRGNHQAGEAGATADIQKAALAINPIAEPQDLGADGNRDRNNAVEDMEYDLVGVPRMRGKVYLGSPYRQRRRHPLNPVEELDGIADHAGRGDCWSELRADLGSDFVGSSWLFGFSRSRLGLLFHVKRPRRPEFGLVWLDYFVKCFT